MALITSAATLNAAVAEWLNRSDLSTSNVGIDLMIQQAEARLKRDYRVRTMTTATFSVDADDETAPSGFRQLISLEHNGPNYYGAIEVVGPDMITELKQRYGPTGVPRACAIIDAGGTFTFRFAPVPDTTFALRATYWATITALSSGSNWLIASHPDIYLYATLAESAMYMKDDERLMVWNNELENRIESLYREHWEHQWSGTPIRNQFTPIG